MKCYRCGYNWEPRTEHPKECPICKAPQPPYIELPKKYREATKNE